MKTFFLRLKKALTIHYGERFNPTRDWLVLLSIAGAVLVLSVAYNAWLFNRVENGESLGASTTVTLPTLNEASLEAVQKVFSDRALEEQKYRNGSYHFVDPSK